MLKLGVDIGGTTIKGGIVEEENIIKDFSVPTNFKQGLEAIKHSLFQVIDNLINYIDENSPIYISATGEVDCNKGEIVEATIKEYKNFNIKKCIEEKYERRVFIDNDCNCALLCEMKYGTVKNVKNSVMFTLGTGLGCAVALDGNIIYGSHYKGLRLGHTILHQNGRICSCGKKGCSESYVSATGLLNTARKYGLNIDDCKQLVNYTNSKILDDIIESFTDDFSIIINNIIDLLDPEIIVIGGGLIYLSNLWWKKLLSKTNQTVVIKKAMFKNSSGIIGATLLA